MRRSPLAERGVAFLLCGALLGGMLVRRLSVGEGLGGGGVELLGGIAAGSGAGGGAGITVSSSAAVGRAFAVVVPEEWTPGSELFVSVPRRGQMLLNVPAGVGPGQKFFFQLSAEAREAASPVEAVRRPGSRAEARTQGLEDLSLGGMLDFERKIRDSMGKLRNTWKKIPQSMLAAQSMLAVQHLDDANFISEKDASKEKGWDPKNPNGFPAIKKTDVNNTNGVPGYTFSLNGEDLGVADQGPGYYQPKDPEHQLDYLNMLRTDCFSNKAKWRDHSNCAALIYRSHTYPNDDPFRFSGAFGWNPPFPKGAKAVNKKGAVAPGANQFWNYGTDDDIAWAALWNGKKFVPPPPTSTPAP